MKIGVICFTSRGCELAKRIADVLNDDECEVFSKTSASCVGTVPVEGSAGKWTEEAFRRYRGVVFVGALGIAVRYIAPHITSKTVDPAVVCVDERGRYAIAVLSGHIGGGNLLAGRIAEGIGAEAVITTATDLGGLFSVDSYATARNMHIGSLSIAKDVSSLIVDGKSVGILSELPVAGAAPPELVPSDAGDVGIYISFRNSPGPFGRTLKLTPRCHVLGVGCRRGVPRDVIERVVRSVLTDNDVSFHSIRMVASIDLKSNEAGLIEFCSAHGFESKFFTAEALASVRDMGFSSSERVKAATGVDNVCERAAVAAASEDGFLAVRKTCMDGVTVAVVREPAAMDFGDVR
ncbi:MAG: cobalamin biosynthesis protein [Candidatus Methanoplasma sp.]|jgi:cobalt-precorrin 5A hydrolase|nr:cobalamin biosynthesis protein [Candidatus Methanoplasma sp.]